MLTVRTGPIMGLIVQLAVLVALAVTTGLGIAGWLAGIATGVVTCAALTRGLNQSGARGLGPANRVTLARTTLVGGVAALAMDSFQRQTPVAVLVALTVVALALDGVDGQVARRTGSISALGARFDMEVDSFLVLVLSVYVARPVGVWVLAIGGMRYAYVAATWALPWMRATLPGRYWRKVVAATQGIALVAATADVLPPLLAVAALMAALALLVESFGRDVGWLWNHRVVAVRSLAAGSLAAGPVAAGPAGDDLVAAGTWAAGPVTDGHRAATLVRQIPFQQRRAQPSGATIQ